MFFVVVIVAVAALAVYLVTQRSESGANLAQGADERKKQLNKTADQH